MFSIDQIQWNKYNLFYWTEHKNTKYQIQKQKQDYIQGWRFVYCKLLL